MDQDTHGVLDRILALLEQQDHEELKRFLSPMHPADLAEVLLELDDDQRALVVGLVTPEAAAETIAEMEPEDQASILESLEDKQVSDILDEMSADDAADLVGEMSPQQAGELLRLMDAEDASDVRELLEYDEDTAGGIMTTEFMALPGRLTAQEAIEELRRLAPDAETAYYVYVVNEKGQLQGVLSLRELIVAPPSRPIFQIMRTSTLSVHVDEDQEEVARVVKKYNLLAVPVIDHNNVLRGIVTVDDIIDVIEEEATEDIYRAAGVASEEEQDLQSGVWPVIRARLPWLVGLLFLSMLSAKVIEQFEGAIATAAVLSVFITTMAGESGNAATQALAVVVRGLATGDLDSGQLWHTVWRELRVGVTVGAVCGSVFALIAVVWQGQPWLGLVVGSAMFVNLIIAKATGAFVPFIIHRLGLDPAVASGPFITTVTDSTSMLIYFGIATLVLRYVNMG